jgi:hypothetical protein
VTINDNEEPGQRLSYGLTTEEPRFDSRQRQEIFLFSIMSWPALGPSKPLIQWVPGAVSPGLMRQGRDADYSPPSSVEVKNGGDILLHGEGFKKLSPVITLHFTNDSGTSFHSCSRFAISTHNLEDCAHNIQLLTEDQVDTVIKQGQNEV